MYLFCCITCHITCRNNCKTLTNPRHKTLHSCVTPASLGTAWLCQQAKGRKPLILSAFQPPRSCLKERFFCIVSKKKSYKKQRQNKNKRERRKRIRKRKRGREEKDKDLRRGGLKNSGQDKSGWMVRIHMLGSNIKYN